MYNGKVCKFGGSSLADADKIKQAAGIILGDDDRRIVVVSAFGGVTNQLIELVETQHRNHRVDFQPMQHLEKKLLSISQGLGIDDNTNRFMHDLDTRLREEYSNPKQHSDNVKAWGEYATGLFMTEYLNKMGANAKFIDSKEMIVVSDDFGNAIILPESDEKIIAELGNLEEIAVTSGFYGSTKNGVIAALPRGGSDTVGGKIAGVLRAEIYENFTDVDNIRRVSCIEDALPIDVMTYDEAMGLSYLGFSVLKVDAIKPCLEADVPIHVRNTFNPDKEGTWIVKHRKSDDHAITGIAFKPGYCSLNIRKVLFSRDPNHILATYLLHTEVGVTSFGEFPIEHAPTDVSNISFIIPQEYFTNMTVNRVTRHLADYFKIPSDDITPDYNPISLISVVGQGMKEKPGVSARIAGAIALEGVNIKFITQGASELSIIYGVNETNNEPVNARKAVEAIYNEFFVEPKIGRALNLVK
ncbi:hypothetical protein CEE44_01470 [Candidatus Woesearchaeota archaeon B3_Woes]|nr:MAG: hypothetical protein CEE44_01470 [Candidatus Woesearchaeota archaeon B3_Woes]